MKVSELKKGMLIECVNDDECFVLSGSGWKVHNNEPPWLMVAKRRRRGWNYPKNMVSKFAMYLGTKKDANVVMGYCNKFVLIDNKIAGVDPAAWRKIKAVDEDR